MGGADGTFACKSQECLWQDWYILFKDLFLSPQCCLGYCGIELAKNHISLNMGSFIPISVTYLQRHIHGESTRLTMPEDHRDPAKA